MESCSATLVRHPPEQRRPDVSQFHRLQKRSIDDSAPAIRPSLSSFSATAASVAAVDRRSWSAPALLAGVWIFVVCS